MPATILKNWTQLPRSPPISKRPLQAQFYLTQFVDYRDKEGLFAKSRIVLIEDRPFLAHHAMNDHWMIHYLNAGMMEDAAKRDREAAAMAAFDEGFARRHAEAFRAIRAAARARLPHPRLQRDAGWQPVFIRGRHDHDRACDGPRRSLPLQEARDGADFRRVSWVFVGPSR